jgi:hypothetical protein
MRKPKSARETKDMIQTALWLPRDMHRRLKTAAPDGKMSEEIRRRLEVSLREPTDEHTDVLLDLVTKVAQSLSTDGRWWADPFAFAVFKTAINELLFYIPRVEPGPESVSNLKTRYGEDAAPETIGKALAQGVLASNTDELIQLRLASDRHLTRAHPSAG